MLEMESPAASGQANRADRKAVGPGTRQADEYHTRESLFERYPDAHYLSVYDGQVRLGFIVDLGSGEPSFAYDRHDRWLGAFRNRKLAMAAVGGAA